MYGKNGALLYCVTKSKTKNTQMSLYQYNSQILQTMILFYALLLL